ncbi:MAG TPA: hypothetical protein VHG69_04445 [Thermoleophilaceae bacterium]|nr:hypothetical protein [Thermoleophilaceae bacterium]
MPRRLLLFLGLALLLLSAPAQAADPIMPLSEVRPGLDCEGLSVVRGTEISEFDVEIIDVVAGGPPSATRILVRVSGPAVDATGIGPGFSGSPVLCDDGSGTRRTAGAISEGVGEYGNKMVLATPIETMLGARPEAPGGRRSGAGAALLRSARPLGLLTFSGLPPEVRRVLGSAARRARRPVLAAPAGPVGSFPPQDLRPGAAVGASLISGDLSTAAVGTVTYRDGDALWAFGHQLDALGARSLMLSDAYVFSVVNNPLGIPEVSTYKLAAPGHVLGSVTNDTFGAIVGRTGPAPRTIPFTVNVRDRDTRRAVALSSQVADESTHHLGTGLPLMGSLGISSAVADLLASEPLRISSSLCLRISIRQRSRPLGFCNKYFDLEGPFTDAQAALGLVDSYDFSPLTVTGVTARMGVERGVREGFLLRGSAPRRVRPGQVIRVRLRLRLRRGPRTSLTARLRVPRDLSPGRRLLRIVGRDARPLDEALEGELVFFLLGEEEGGGERSPRSIRELAARIAALRKPPGLRASFRRGEEARLFYRNAETLIRGRISIPLRVVRRGRR